MTYKLISFKDCNLNDEFFDSLREDYSDFNNWFAKRSMNGSMAYIDFDENENIHAFLSIKPELENTNLGIEPVLPPMKRMKISTLKIDDSVEGQRLGEGAIGIALWKWKDSDAQQIYVTVFEKHERLIGLLDIFGFKMVSVNERGERIFLKDKTQLDYLTLKKSFPYINPGYKKSKYLPINDEYHDKMFQYSELRGIPQKEMNLPVSNGITKTFIATPYDATTFDYEEKDLVFIYRKHSGTGKIHHSAVTSFCTVSRISKIKSNGKFLVTFDDYKKIVGNKSIYTDDEISSIYRSKRNVFVLELIYNGYFGEGNNISLSELMNNDLWNDEHPYNSHITDEGVRKIFRLGGTDVHNVIIN